MAFADPQSLKVGSATAVALPRTSSGVDNGAFRTNDGTLALRVSHAYGAKRNRRTIRIDSTKVAPDPFTGVNTQFSGSVYIVSDFPGGGYSIAEQKDLVNALTAYLTSDKVTQLLGGEN